MKKLFCICITLLLCLTQITVLANGTEPSNNSVLDQELAQATALGFDMDAVAQTTVSGREMATLLDGFVACVAPDSLAGWQASYPAFRQYDGALTRFNAMAALFLAAQQIGGAYALAGEPSNQRSLLPMDWQEDYILWDLFGGFDAMSYFDIGVYQGCLDVVSYHYTLSHASDFSGEYPLALDAASHTLRVKENITYTEALLAIVRLMSSVDPARFGSRPANDLDASVLTPALLQKAAALPEATASSHPQWTGFVLNWDVNGVCDATESNIRHIADWGFNSVRLNVEYPLLFDREDVSLGKTANLRALDSLIAACIENGVHLNLCLSSLPGRESYNDDTTFTSTGAFDLFINATEQERADAVWSALAARYRDIPSASLSFTPFIEAMNGSLSTGLPVPRYSAYDVGTYLKRVIGVIRAQDENRLIVYEPTMVNDAGGIIADGRVVKAVIKDIPNVMIEYNFCECVYVYDNMTATPGQHIDNNNHSLDVQRYPTQLYEVAKTIRPNEPLTLTGFLPEGTVIDLYLELSKGGEITFQTEQDTVYTEKLDAAVYATGELLSRNHPYATSEKHITITLEKAAKRVVIATTADMKWCGMNVTLPKEYAVERWYYATEYDKYLGLVDEIGLANRLTSHILISPNENGGRIVTIGEDITYTSDQKGGAASKRTVEEWSTDIKGFDGNCAVRVECGAFSSAIWSDLKTYYNDVFGMLSRNKMSWWSNDFWIMTESFAQIYAIAECPSTEYDGFATFNLELLELLQTYQAK